MRIGVSLRPVTELAINQRGIADLPPPRDKITAIGMFPTFIAEHLAFDRQRRGIEVLAGEIMTRADQGMHRAFVDLAKI